MIDCGEAFGGERKIASGLYQFYRPEDIEVNKVLIILEIGTFGDCCCQPQGKASCWLS